LSHEITTAALPAFLASLGVAAALLGVIEGVADGLSSFAKMASGFYTDKLRRRKPITAGGYFPTALCHGRLRTRDEMHGMRLRFSSARRSEFLRLLSRAGSGAARSD